jgi:hypothetical protein
MDMAWSNRPAYREGFPHVREDVYYRNHAQQLHQQAQQGQQAKQKSQQVVEQINEWWDRIVQLSDQA